MLRDEDELMESAQEKLPGAYVDKELGHNPGRQREFMRLLIEAGLNGLVLRERFRVTPFLVEKRNQKLRLIWGCRRANRFFRDPPGLDMGTGDCLQNSSWTTSGTCGRPRRTSPMIVVSVPCRRCCNESADEFRCWGLATYSDRGAQPRHVRISLALRVYPMGWSWACGGIQRLHEEIAAKCGFMAETRLTSSWIPPGLAAGPACPPFCENFTVSGMKAQDVQAGLDKMTNAFEELGFKLHEFSGLKRGI